MMNKTKKIYLDLHVIQSLPPNGLNRGEDGRPKSCIYGGVNRLRVSAPSWGRAMRRMFRNMFDSDDNGLRTLHVDSLIVDEIMASYAADVLQVQEEDKEAGSISDMVTAALGLIKIKTDDKDQPAEDNGDDEVTETEKKQKALYFISPAEVRAYAKVITDIYRKQPSRRRALEEDGKKGRKVDAIILDKKLDRAALMNAGNTIPAYDVAMFGRMVADNPGLNIDASRQMAHAISTHAAFEEMDYFSAVDDCASDTAGAGYIGENWFGSATVYRYANIDITALCGQLGGSLPDTVEAVAGFIRAFALSTPSGRQNTYAANTVPDALYAAIRTDMPVSFAAAFEKPVRCTQASGYAEGSVQRLMDYAGEVYDLWVGKPEKEFTSGTLMAGREDRMPLSGITDGVAAYITEALS